MSHPSAATNPYDDVPYPSKPQPQSHPDRLAALATLFGMQPPAIDHCRVLELGCASGGNLIPMAERHPESTFVGIDYSREQIAAGRRRADALALENLDLRCASIIEVGDELGKFDYIICHGVFSWVPPAVQDKILTLCRKLLNEQGVAYVSYNILPGWHLRMILRDLLLRHAPSGEATSQRLAKGRALAKFLSDALGQQPTPFAKLFKYHADSFLGQSDAYLCHEEFESDNRPLYFHEFTARAAASGLQYLGEAALATMFVSNFGPVVEQHVRRLADDTISVEQHLDALRDRRFRETLLCHQGVSLARHITHEGLQKLFVYGSFRPHNDPPDLKTTATEQFSGSRGLTISSPAPLLKAVLYHLGTQWPRAMNVDELISTAATLAGNGSPAAISDADRRGLVSSIAKCVANGMIEPTSAPDSFVTALSVCPQASRLARFEARTSKVVTNRRHRQRTLDDDTQNIIKYLDGEHDRQALLRLLMAAFDRGELSILIGGIPATSEQVVSDTLRDTLERCLTKLAVNALLVA